MILKYLQQLKDNPNLTAGIYLEGLSQKEITSLEIKFNDGNKFPLAFHEYLQLGGIRSGTGVVDNDFEYLREECEIDLKNSGYTMKRPFFVFDDLYGQYSIFFLDENIEDPNIYILFPTAARDGSEPLLRDVKYTFSKMINNAIYRKKNNIPM